MVAFFAFKCNPGLQLKFQFASRDISKKIGSYGLVAALSVAAIRIIYQVDTVVVGAALGAAAVTIYAIPVILVEQFRMITQQSATVLTSRLSGLNPEIDRELMKKLLLKWACLGQVMALAVGLPLLITGGDFIELWMGEEFSQCKVILQLLTIPFFFILPSLGFSSLLYATDRQALYAKIAVSEACANLLLSIIFVHFFGLSGVALGTLVPALLFRGFLLPRFSLMLVHMSFQEFLKTAYLRYTGIAFFHLLVLLSLQVFIGAENWFSFILNNGIGLIIFLTVTYLFGVDEEDRDYLKRRLGLVKAEKEQ